MLSQYAYYIAIVRLPHIFGQSAKIYAGVGEGTPDGVLRLRIGSRNVEVPLPGGGPRSRLQGPGDLLSHRRLHSRRLRPDSAKLSADGQPACFHPRAARQSVLASGVQSARCPGADQPAPGQQLRLEAALQPRQGVDDDTRRFGARPCVGGVSRPDALPGRPRTVPGRRIAPKPFSISNVPTRTEPGSRMTTRPLDRNRSRLGPDNADFPIGTAKERPSRRASSIAPSTAACTGCREKLDSASASDGQYAVR